MDRRYDLVMASLFIAVGAGLLVYAANYPEPSVVFDTIGPMGFPAALGLFFVGGGVLQAVRDVKVLQTVGRFGVDEGKEDDEEELPASAAQAFKVMAGSMLYLVLMQLVGFLVATPVVVGAGLSLLKTPKRRLIVVSLVFTAVTYLMFGVALGVPLPVGRAFGFLGAVLIPVGLL